MVIFYSYVSLPEGILMVDRPVWILGDLRFPAMTRCENQAVVDEEKGEAVAGRVGPLNDSQVV